MADPLRWCRRAVMVALVGLTASCGGGSPSRPSPTPTPSLTPLPPVIVAERTGVALPNGFIAWLPFPTSRAGRLDATADWTLGTNNLDVYLVRGECNYDQLAAGQCEVLVASESLTAKPETVRYESPAASTYTIFVNNLGPGDESVSFQVVLRATLGGLGGVATTSAAGGPVHVRPARRLGADP